MVNPNRITKPSLETPSLGDRSSHTRSVGEQGTSPISSPNLWASLLIMWPRAAARCWYIPSALEEQRSSTSQSRELRKERMLERVKAKSKLDPKADACLLHPRRSMHDCSASCHPKALTAPLRILRPSRRRTTLASETIKATTRRPVDDHLRNNGAVCLRLCG